MRVWRVLLAVATASGVTRSGAAETCCLNRSCEVRDAQGCAALGGIAGYCHPTQACGADPCQVPLGGRDLLAVKAGVDVVFTLDPIPPAIRYYTFFSPVREGQPCANCPGSLPVPDCAPSTVPEARHVGAVMGPGSELWLYAAVAGCDASGACCIALGCLDDMSRAPCESQGGSFQGDATSCGAGPFCSIFRLGACCSSETTCFDADPASCAVQGQYLGDGTSCQTSGCAGTWGACCVGTACAHTWADDCARRPGTFHPGLGCSPGPC